jgi:hypothetical protein
MMNLSRTFAVCTFAALAVFALANSLPAQEINTPIITVRSLPPTQPKRVKTRFAVLHMFINTIQVRSLVNGLEIHTFTYSDQINSGMQALFEQGGYQYGDIVTIWYLPRTDIALKIKGTPSKPR